MDNNNTIQPEVLSSIALLNVGGQPYIEYNVNGMRDAFALSWEQVAQMQTNWRNDLFFLRGEREKAVAERQTETAEKTEEVTEAIPNIGEDEESRLNPDLDGNMQESAEGEQ